MTASDKCYSFIKNFEGCRLKAYNDGVGIMTIGYGSTMYPEGTRVKEGDVITQERAEFLIKWEVILKTKSIAVFLYNVILKQQQFDALISFAYNVGVGNFKKSTLLKKVKVNPADITIRDEFMKWNRAGGIVLNGLTKRRAAEADLYFSTG